LNRPDVKSAETVRACFYTANLQKAGGAMLTRMFQILTAMLHRGGIFFAIGWDGGKAGGIGGWRDTKLLVAWKPLNKSLVFVP
jgi:hypothetical protein